MPDFNKQIIIGHLGSDAEVKEVGGSTLVILNVATNYEWTHAGEKHVSREWHRVEVWGNLGKLSEEFKKGHQVFIEGPTITKSWEDSTGTARSQKIVKATNVSFLGFGGGIPEEFVPGSFAQTKSPT